MPDKRGIRTPLGNRSFGRIVGIVDVEERLSSRCYRGETVLRECRSFSGQEFQISVGADMDKYVGIVYALEIVICRKILVRRRAVGIVENLTDRAVALRSETTPFGLNGDDCVSEFQTRYQNPAVQHHAFAGRLPPDLNHPLLNRLAERGEIFHVFLRAHLIQSAAASDNLRLGCPAKLRNCLLFKEKVHQFLCRCRNPDVVARILKAREDVYNALCRVQMRRRTDICLDACTGVVV